MNKPEPSEWELAEQLEKEYSLRVRFDPDSIKTVFLKILKAYGERREAEGFSRGIDQAAGVCEERDYETGWVLSERIRALRRS